MFGRFCQVPTTPIKALLFYRTKLTRHLYIQFKLSCNLLPRTVPLIVLLFVFRNIQYLHTIHGDLFLAIILHYRYC